MKNSLVHTLRLLLRFVCAVQDIAAKTLRVDRKTAQIFGQKEDCAVAAITELMSIVFRELRRQVGTCRRLLSFVDIFLLSSCKHVSHGVNWIMYTKVFLAFGVSNRSNIVTETKKKTAYEKLFEKYREIDAQANRETVVKKINE